MNKDSDSQNIPNVPSNEPEMLVLIKKLQRHLVFLEKKIDILIEGASRKPFDREKRFSKPNRSGGGPPSNRRAWAGGGNQSSERNFGRPSSFGQPRGGQGQGFSRRKNQSFQHKRDR